MEGFTCWAEVALLSKIYGEQKALSRADEEFQFIACWRTAIDIEAKEDDE